MVLMDGFDREWTEDGQLWVQYVSSTPATRLDVINLQEELDRKLQQRQARETGICPVREELYSQTFDELIRQVTRNPRFGAHLVPDCFPSSIAKRHGLLAFGMV